MPCGETANVSDPWAAHSTHPVSSNPAKDAWSSYNPHVKPLPFSIANIPTPSRRRQVPREELVSAPVVSPIVKQELVTSCLPPVVSVRKMTAKGCAIVILRDSAVLELSVAMQVAIVDGVCIEVRRHSRRSKRDEEQPLGVFCAWGFRVERRMPVSEEGLEAYFNGLATVAEPDGLHVEAPFEEKLQLFPLSSEAPLMLDKAPQWDDAEPSQMLRGPHGHPDLVHNLWAAKQQLEDMWSKPPPPFGRSLMQRVAREQLFPHSGKEGKEHENRAGEKLEELSAAVGLLEGVPSGSAFLDLCGGPGAWSQFLLGKSELAMRGFGFTLRSNSGDENDWQAQEKDDWYPELSENPNWTALWGEDGSGDLLNPKNLHHSTQELRKQGGVFLCVADGGFSDKAIPPNLLELYFYRLLLGELLTAASCLQPGGRFVCKLYTACSAATSSLLFLATRLFENVVVVKPMTSRVAGPERYLYASGFRQGVETDEIVAALWQSQLLGDGAGPLQAPLLTPIVPATELCKDAGFLVQLSAMVSCLCQRQSGALRAIVNRAELLESIALEASEQATGGNSQHWQAAALAAAEAQHQEEIAAQEMTQPSPTVCLNNEFRWQ